MAKRAENEGFRLLDDFVCEAIHAPGIPTATSQQEDPANGGGRHTASANVAGHSCTCSILATAIYDILRSLVPSPRAEITYSELVQQLGPLRAPNQDLQPRDSRLDSALGELVAACRRRNL